MVKTGMLLNSLVLGLCPISSHDLIVPKTQPNMGRFRPLSEGQGLQSHPGFHPFQVGCLMISPLGLKTGLRFITIHFLQTNWVQFPLLTIAIQ